MEVLMYESLVILNQESNEQEIEKFINDIKLTIEANNGKVKKTYKEGLKKLCYSVKGNEKGYFITFYIEIEEKDRKAIVELERVYKIKDIVIKFLTIRLLPETIEEHIKRTEKEIKRYQYKNTKEKIIAEAQKWQQRQEATSWGEVAEIQNYFKKMARRYGLVKEFKENGVI